jgi:predicted transcriptional regulator
MSRFFLTVVEKRIFCSTLSEFENFLLCEQILDKCHHLSKRNVKLILKILSNLEPLRGSSNKKTLYSTRSCVNWGFLALVGL